MFSYVNAQVVTVKDAKSKKPIELVAIMSDNPKAFVITNKLGKADIASFKGAEKIAIRLLGYKSMLTSYAELENGLEILIEPSQIEMDEVVISATKWSQSSSDVPAKVTSISAKDIALQNPQTAADLLGASGEVFIQKSQQGGGSPIIRGFATNRLLYSIDGVRMNTAIFRSGNLQNVISLDPFTMEHSEVLFGPGSVIYGSDAIGGVMNFQTLTPQFSFTDTPLITGKAVVRYATANTENTGHFDVNIGWKKWALVSSVSANNYGHLKMGTYGPDEYLRPFYVERQNNTDVIILNNNPKEQIPSGYHQINMMQKIRFKPNEKWDVEYGFHYSETSNYDRYDRHIRFKNGLPQYGEWYYGPQKWMMNNLSISHSRSNVLFDQLTIRLAHQFFEESRISRNLYQNNRESRTENVHAYSFNIDLHKSMGKKHTLFYGIEAVYDDVVSKGINEDVATGKITKGASRYPPSSWGSYGIYLSDQFKVSEKLTLNAGARYNQYVLEATFDTTFYPFPFVSTSLNNGALTGSVGMVYKPTEKWAISSNFSTGFRSPNVDDLGKVFDSEPGMVVVPNPDLKAENAYNVDLGIAKVFGQAVKVDVTGYYTFLQNAMVRRDFTLNGQDSLFYDGTLSQVQAIQNAAVTSVYGIQTGVEIKLASGFSISSRYNYQKGEEELNDGTKSPSRHAVPWFGVSRLTYSKENFTLQLYATYSGERKFEDMPEEEKGKDFMYAKDANGNPYSPAWYTLNFKALYEFTEHFILTAGIENVTDQRYLPYSSGLIAPGRNFILALKANF